jgi:UDP-N-acetyl-D-mannosaminuronate dehydrogenase
MKKVSDQVVAVIGLGYVGLPLAVHFARKYQTIGFDMNKQKVARLAKQVDTTGEVSREEFDEAVEHYGIKLHKWEELKDLKALIIAVGHKAYKEKPVQQYVKKLGAGGCLLDVKAILDVGEVAKTGVTYWRL